MAKDQRVESVLKRMGVQFRYAPELPIEDITQQGQYQVRHSSAGPDQLTAPTIEVKKYHQLLLAGADFPPIVVSETEKGVLDGNTRLGAFKKAKRATIPAYVVDIRSARTGRTIAVAMNAQAGNRMSKGEIVDWVKGLNGDTPSAADFTLYTGYNPKMLKRITDARDFDERARRLDVIPNWKLPETTKGYLRNVALDSVFIELTQLVTDAGFDSAEARALIKLVTAAASETEQLVLAAEQRSVNAGRIQDRQVGFSGVSSMVHRQVNMHAGWLIANARKDGLSDPDSNTRPATQRRLEDLVDAVRYALQTSYGA